MEPIFSVKGVAAILRMYTDHVEGEYFGVEALGGKKPYVAKYSNIKSIDLVEGTLWQNSYMKINYEGNQISETSKMFFRTSPKKFLLFKKAKLLIEFLIANTFNDDEIKKILSMELTQNEIESSKNSKNKQWAGAIFSAAIIFVMVYFMFFNSSENNSITNTNGFSPAADATTKAEVEVKTGVEALDKNIGKNNELIPEIGTSYGYMWESINTDAQIYGTLGFDGLTFRMISYTMNGKTNSEDFTKVIDFSGKWSAIDSQNAQGVYEINNVTVSWKFSADYSTLVNKKGIIFQRIKVK